MAAVGETHSLLGIFGSEWALGKTEAAVTESCPMGRPLAAPAQDSGPSQGRLRCWCPALPHRPVDLDVVCVASPGLSDVTSMDVGRKALSCCAVAEEAGGLHHL